MRIVLLTPGTGHFYCGNCLRDNTLAHTFKQQGHDVTMIPLYLPIHTETPTPSQSPEIFLGGINFYLQHKLPFLGRLPGFMMRLLDSPGLLRWSSKQGDMTDAAKHADLTLAMLRSEEKGTIQEIRRLLRWMKEHDPPDVISLCNVLLVGLAHVIKSELDVKIVSNLHGEDGFLDALPGSKRDEAWRILRERVNDIDGFIPVSHDYAKRMGSRLGIDESKLHVVHNGISLDDVDLYHVRPADGESNTIGFLARMCPEKGLETLIDAFIELEKRKALSDLKLIVVGVQLKVDRPYVAGLQSRLREAGCLEKVEFRPNITREEKLAFLKSIDAFSVPTTGGEAFGLYVIEAMAHGVPVVQPRHGAFPEILERAGGGLLCEPDDPISLADEIQRLLLDHELAEKLSRRGRQAVIEYFNADRMAADVVKVYDGLLQPRSIPEPDSVTSS